MNLKKLHSIAAYVSSVRRLLSRTVACMWEERITYSKAEIDSHADTFVLGRNCLVFAFIGRACDVSPYYTDSNDSIRVFPLTGATARTSHVGREMYTVMFHNAFWMGEAGNRPFISQSKTVTSPWCNGTRQQPVWPHSHAYSCRRRINDDPTTIWRNVRISSPLGPQLNGNHRNVVTWR